jgi:Mg2+ and Co2+ transporter CorA
METLRKLAELPAWKFKPTPLESPYFKNIRAKTYTNKSPSYVSGHDSQVSLLEREKQAYRSNLTANLTLICIPRDDMEYIRMDHDGFMELFNAFGIDPRFLHLIKNNRYGFHHEKFAERLSYYIGTVQYTLLWSFHPETRRTRALLLIRDSDGYSHGAKAFEDFAKILEMESRSLHTPFLLAWVVLVHLSNWIDVITYAELSNIRRLEDTTGHGPYGTSKSAGEIAMGDLTRASEKVGSMLANLANQSRHIAIGNSLASYLISVNHQSSYPLGFAVESFHKVYREEIGNLADAIPSLQRSLDDSKAYVQYLQERARTQASVVNALVTHEDAYSNIVLATAAKEDGSAMKTIAMMTMLFLPGTFFAALWAVPSLQWDQPGVIQTNFWVYWAFTIPSTLIVFAVWFGLHRWRYASGYKGAAKSDAQHSSTTLPLRPNLANTTTTTLATKETIMQTSVPMTDSNIERGKAMRLGEHGYATAVKTSVPVGY